VLKDSILKFLNLEGLVHNLTGYVETRMELLKLELREDLAKTLSKLIVFSAISLMTLMFIFFISTAAAYMIGTYLGMFAGFAIVAAFYLAIALLLWLMRDSLGAELEKRLTEKITLKKK